MGRLPVPICVDHQGTIHLLLTDVIMPGRMAANLPTASPRLPT